MSSERFEQGIVVQKYNLLSGSEKYRAFRSLLSNPLAKQLLSQKEQELLNSLAQFPLIRYFPASKNKKITKEAYEAFSAILNGEAINQQKEILAKLKIHDRKEMSLRILDKLFIAGIIALNIGVGALAWFSLAGGALWVFLGFFPVICTVDILYFLAKRSMEFDKQVDHEWEWGYLQGFLDALTEEHQALFTKINSPDFQNALSQSSASTAMFPSPVAQPSNTPPGIASSASPPVKPILT